MPGLVLKEQERAAIGDRDHDGIEAAIVGTVVDERQELRKIGIKAG